MAMRDHALEAFLLEEGKYSSRSDPLLEDSQGCAELSISLYFTVSNSTPVHCLTLFKP